jgi:hypothetical protein
LIRLVHLRLSGIRSTVTRYTYSTVLYGTVPGTIPGTVTVPTVRVGTWYGKVIPTVVQYVPVVLSLTTSAESGGDILNRKIRGFCTGSWDIYDIRTGRTMYWNSVHLLLENGLLYHTRTCVVTFIVLDYSYLEGPGHALVPRSAQ